MNSAREVGGEAGLTPIERKIQAVFAGGLAALGVLGAVSYVGIDQLLEQSARAEHSRGVIESVRGMLVFVTDAEAAQRAFVVTGNNALIEPFERAAHGAVEDLRTLRSLTADNADQQRRLDALEPLLTERLNGLSGLIDLRRAQGPAAIRPAMEEEVGRLIQHPVRRALQDFEAAERTLLQEREARARQRARLAAGVIASGAVVAVLLLAAAVIVI